MIVVTTKTARGKALYARAIRNEGKKLWDVYASYSTEKARAWDKCFKKCHDEGGEDFHICTHCQQNFTVAWKVADGFRMETANNSYHIVVVKEN